MPGKWKCKCYGLMSCLSSPLHHVVGITEAMAPYSPVTTFHSLPGHQKETETSRFRAECKEDSFFSRLKDFGAFLIEFWSTILPQPAHGGCTQCDDFSRFKGALSCRNTFHSWIHCATSLGLFTLPALCYSSSLSFPKNRKVIKVKVKTFPAHFSCFSFFLFFQKKDFGF